MGARVL